jgi:hypothetical protein
MSLNLREDFTKVRNLQAKGTAIGVVAGYCGFNILLTVFEKATSLNAGSVSATLLGLGMVAGSIAYSQNCNKKANAIIEAAVQSAEKSPAP